MGDLMDIVDLATELARIASKTTDPAAARRLMAIVRRLLSEAGLPHDDDGGGEAPTGSLSEPACEAA